MFCLNLVLHNHKIKMVIMIAGGGVTKLKF